jgi:hypothetical protein
MRVSRAPPEDASPEVSETVDGDDEDAVVTRVGPLDVLGAVDALPPAGAGCG